MKSVTLKGGATMRYVLVDKSVYVIAEDLPASANQIRHIVARAERLKSADLRVMRAVPV